MECRLLLVSLFVGLMARIGRQPAKPSMFVIAIVLSTVLFGVGHLPAAFTAAIAASPLLIGKIVLLNPIVGSLTGTLFCRFGLEHAMVAPFTADLMPDVAVPLLGIG